MKPKPGWPASWNQSRELDYVAKESSVHMGLTVL